MRSTNHMLLRWVTAVYAVALVASVSLVPPAFGQAAGCHLLGPQPQRLYSDLVSNGAKLDTECAIHIMTTKGVMIDCGGDAFCRIAYATRGELAFDLVSGKYAKLGTTPAFLPLTTHFTDAAAGWPLTCWIEQAKADGITGGCTDVAFCTNSLVTRRQMAKMLLMALEGSNYNPPDCSLLSERRFTDINCPSAITDPVTHLLDSFVEELVRRGITLGCTATQYCPDANVTRQQVALFMRRMFGWTATSCPQ